ncbi:hypothetical protein [Micromonospora ureilytica]|uniref:Uncharacterized protein n=1 Tax=Micromonospora ureilytica TaxID=709868 RepID=A0ABS0JIW3_9ACTN|nr:hypothetical protein [Micromonospora ureilytica]MBG6067009.1 hypothetical protein [Micromonospora ureilytica]
MDRHQLIALLAGGGSAYAMCRDALHDGADFTIANGAMPATHFARIYDRRKRHCQERGIATLGFRQGVERLQNARNHAVRLGWVKVANPDYHFQLFLTEDLSAVIACIGVDQAHQVRRDDGPELTSSV